MPQNKFLFSFCSFPERARETSNIKSLALSEIAQTFDFISFGKIGHQIQTLERRLNNCEISPLFNFFGQVALQPCNLRITGWPAIISVVLAFKT
jgi:hypothetical protein